jgi:hypothetical protein
MISKPVLIFVAHLKEKRKNNKEKKKRKKEGNPDENKKKKSREPKNRGQLMPPKGLAGWKPQFNRDTRNFKPKVALKHKKHVRYDIR